MSKNSICKGVAVGWSAKEVIIQTDGASRGNPGEASFGLVVYDKSFQVVYEEGALLGTQTNNFAEYSAALRALELACKNQVHSLILQSDSKLLVCQLTGKYRVRSANIRALHRDCIEKVAGIGKVQFEHIPREQNLRADELANLILDGHQKII